MTTSSQQMTTEQALKEAKALALFRRGVVLSKLYFNGADDGGYWVPDQYGDLTPDQCGKLRLFLQDIGDGDSETGAYSLIDVAAAAWGYLFPSHPVDAIVAPLPLALSARDGALVLSGLFMAKGDKPAEDGWKDISNEWGALIPHPGTAALSGKEAHQ